MNNLDNIYIQTVYDMDAMFYEPLVGVIRTQIHLFVENHVREQVWKKVYTQIGRQVKFVIAEQIENEMQNE